MWVSCHWIELRLDGDNEMLKRWFIGWVIAMGIIAVTIWATRIPDQKLQHPSPTTAAKQLTDIERNCLGMYLKYGDVKASNLTMSQIDGNRHCQDLGCTAI